MVKHARTKKRRAGRIGKTKLKNGSFHKFKPPQIRDPIIKAKWDPTKSPAQNLRNLGLTALPNADINSRGRADDVVITPSSNGSIATDGNGTVNNNKFIELYGTRKEATSPHLPVSIEDQKYLVRCFAKYGDDYKKMSRDIKVNDMQHTERRLQKLGDGFMLLTEAQRRVDVPESIRHLVA